MGKFDAAFFDAGCPRQGTDCVKWDGMLAEFGDPEMVPLWVADMDFRSAPAIAEAVRKVADQGTWGYTVSGRADNEALAGFWQRRHGVGIDPDWVLLSPCVVTGMHVAIRALTAPDEGVLIMPPVYGPFRFSIADTGRPLVESPLIQDETGWHMNFADMEEKLSSGAARAVMLCSPHNPCGRAWTREELQRLLDLCNRHEAALISDEIHADFVFRPNTFVSVLALDGDLSRTVMLCAASKTFNTAGLQQSAIVCPDSALREKLKADRDHAGITQGNVFALAATRAAYTDCDEWLDGLMEYLEGNRELVYAAARKWDKVKVSRLEATYLMWLNCRDLGLSQEELMAKVHAAHVHLNDGLFFGELGRDCLRLNIACPRAQLEEGLRRLDTVFA